MDLIILIVFLLLIVLVFKRFSSFVYFLVIIDLLFRIIHYFKYLVNINELTALINSYVPGSIPGILDKYADGILLTILLFGYLIIYIIFEFYIIRTFIKKK